MPYNSNYDRLLARIGCIADEKTIFRIPTKHILATKRTKHTFYCKIPFKLLHHTLTTNTSHKHTKTHLKIPYYTLTHLNIKHHICTLGININDAPL
jgi:hypothetical protein